MEFIRFDKKEQFLHKRYQKFGSIVANLNNSPKLFYFFNICLIFILDNCTTNTQFVLRKSIESDGSYLGRG